MADKLRVVILGAAGEAQQQLLTALNELGAQTLAVGDFDQLDPDNLRSRKPDVWLVSIDEATDSGRMDRWQPLFDDPASTVIFDDADVTRRLSGWDLARWARHLAAKVLGRDDVLPPVSPGAERLPQPSAGEGDAGSGGDASFAALNASFEASRNRSVGEVAPSIDDVLSGRAPPAQAQAGATSSTAVATSPAPAAAPAPSAKGEFSLLGEDVDLSAPSAPKKAEPNIAFDLSRFELEPLEVAAPEKKEDPNEIKLPTMPPKGVIAIIAGLGGPDAVRQFIGGLPTGLPVPVLVWQHLDAGKHDRLAQQMGKSTGLPVYLPTDGEMARVGEVGIMGARMGVVGDGNWWVRQGSPSPSHALAPALKHQRTVLVVLSGAEPVIVEFARSHKAAGGTVLVQTSSTCFDATATAALEKQGIASGSPGNLAERAAQSVSAK